MATTSVTSGQTASSQVNAGDVEYVQNGGTAAGQTNYGTRYVQSGGVVSGGVLSGTGVDYIEAGGSSYQTAISSGGVRYVESGGTAVNPYLRNGGTIVVSSGGLVTSANGVGGVLSAQAGAIVNSAYASGTNAKIILDNAAILSGTISATQSATVSGGTIGSGVVENISYYASATNQIVASGGVANFYGSTYSSDIIVSGGTLNLNGNTISGYQFQGSDGLITISSGTLNGSNTSAVTDGNTITQSGGTVINQTIGSGGILNVLGGTASSTVIETGGSAVINNGLAKDMSVNGGSVDVVKTSGGASIGFTSGGSGGTITLESGVTFTNTSSSFWVSSGGTYIVNSGAVLNGGHVLSGGTLVVDGGKTSGVILDGGQMYLNNALATTNTTFTSNGGTLYFESGYAGTQTWNLNNNVHAVVSSGASLPNTTVSSTALLDVLSGGTVASTTVLSGGSINIESGGVIGSRLTVSSGGTAVMNGTAGSGIVNLAGDGASLIISGTTMPTNTISGWSPTDTIELASIPQASVTSVTTTSTGITFYTTGGTYSLNVPGASSYGYTLSSDSNGGLIYTTCFAEGTSLMTPDGEATVETLVPGTLVMTPKGAMPVKWLGHRSITVSSQPVPEDNWLVRIREGALANGVPSRDLLVTQEHCMVFEGKLVPARMLVNGASILIDRTINSYTYYHVELDSHEAVWAENALTESYLDTGNRDQFDNHTVTTLFGGSRKMGGSTTLPLETSRAFVEPIHAAIAARATSAAPQPELTTDPDLHLITNFGEIIRPLRQANDRVMFMIPANVESVSLVSRTSRPSDTIGPFVDDRRDLGVLVGDVSLFASRKTVNLTAHLSLPHLAGWHGLESSRYRWTDGNAALHLQDGSTVGRNPSVLSVQIVASGPYLMEAPVTQTELRQVG
ncbi:autotransporter passenger strand-loop-strand repeat protein [Gluconobacter cerinus]|uniref:Hint domain-containing protein n=1 Tax=Gluconobacter cerinus TaxID=38307 RepID=UPI00222778CF|nr:Hint domain-containing protein [Gluconobacter cerinus]MCW2267152.1 autotransporter passenger strand-loop-strand repeat protein [Gluconobacter cerinus]